MPFEFDVLLAEQLQVQKQMLATIQQLASILGQFPLTALPPLAPSPAASGSVNLGPLITAIQAINGPIQSVSSLTLQATANEGLIPGGLHTAQNGGLVVSLRINAGSTGASIQLSRDGGKSYGAFNALAGGVILPGYPYAFDDIVRSGDSIQLSMSEHTTLDYLLVFYTPGRVVTV